MEILLPSIETLRLRIPLDYPDRFATVFLGSKFVSIDDRIQDAPTFALRVMEAITALQSGKAGQNVEDEAGDGLSEDSDDLDLDEVLAKSSPLKKPTATLKLSAPLPLPFHELDQLQRRYLGLKLIRAGTPKPKSGHGAQWIGEEELPKYSAVSCHLFYPHQKKKLRFHTNSRDEIVWLSYS